MSLDIYLKCPHCGTELFSCNITHNLNAMANAAGLYEVMWRPDEYGIVTAEQAIPLLRAGIDRLVEKADNFRALNPPNGWGSYDGLLEVARGYLKACIGDPTATVKVSR